MLGWLALKSLTTLSSTAFCSGASPPPRQQYHRISTGPPGGTVAGPWLAATWLAAVDASDDAAALVAPLAGGEALDPLHAVATMANTASNTPGRDRRDAIAPPPVARGMVSRLRRRWLPVAGRVDSWVRTPGAVAAAPAEATSRPGPSASSSGRRHARCSSGFDRRGRSSARTRPAGLPH